MPNHFSALKRARQTKKRTGVNRSNQGVFRASVRRFRQALASASPEAAQPLLSQTISRIDKAVQKGLIHKNTAARLKSRLTTRVRAVAGQGTK